MALARVILALHVLVAVVACSDDELVARDVGPTLPSPARVRTLEPAPTLASFHVVQDAPRAEEVACECDGSEDVCDPAGDVHYPQQDILTISFREAGVDQARFDACFASPPGSGDCGTSCPADVAVVLLLRATPEADDDTLSMWLRNEVGDFLGNAFGDRYLQFHIENRGEDMFVHTTPEFATITGVQRDAERRRFSLLLNGVTGAEPFTFRVDHSADEAYGDEIAPESDLHDDLFIRSQ